MKSRRISEAEREARRAYQKRYVERLRNEVLAALGGEVCSQCGSTFAVEVDHVDGKNYTARRLSSTARWARYKRELAAGVRLRALCKSCNSGYLNYPYHREKDHAEHGEEADVRHAQVEPGADGGSQEGCGLGEPEHGGIRQALHDEGDGECPPSAEELQHLEDAPF